MSTATPTVSLVRQYGAVPPWRGVVYDPAMADAGIDVDSPAWFTWLQAPTTQGFAYPVYDHAHGYIDGFMTVRQERRQRGGHYWVAYRRCQGRLRKVYLGATATLTQQCLDTLAQTFLAASQALSSAAGTDGDAK